jgi:hypothetical protein
MEELHDNTVKKLNTLIATLENTRTLTLAGKYKEAIRTYKSHDKINMNLDTLGTMGSIAHDCADIKKLLTELLVGGE